MRKIAILLLVLSRCGSAERISVASVGDSLTAGTGTLAGHGLGLTLAETMSKGYDVEVFGSIGSSTEQIRARWEDTVRPKRPAWLVLLGGTNDTLGAGRIPPAVTFANLRAVWEEQLADGGHVVALTIPPFLGFHDMYDPGITACRDAVNAMILEYCVRGSIRCVDTVPLLVSDAGGLRPEYDIGDRLHLSAAGYAVLAKAVAAKIH